MLNRQAWEDYTLVECGTAQVGVNSVIHEEELKG